MDGGSGKKYGDGKGIHQADSDTEKMHELINIYGVFLVSFTSAL